MHYDACPLVNTMAADTTLVRDSALHRDLAAPDKVVDQPLIADRQDCAQSMDPRVLLSAFDESASVLLQLGEEGLPLSLGRFGIIIHSEGLARR